jgi:ppGpp synthetase/RelA/SpoT-type nucleotidyltranferase
MPTKVAELIEDVSSSLITERKGYPPGTVRTWGSYDYEKQKSGKWKKIGKAAGPTGASPDTKSQVATAVKAFHKTAKAAHQEVRLSALKTLIDNKLPHPPPFEQHVEIARSHIQRHKDGLQAKKDKLAALSPPGARIDGRTKELESAVGKVARKPKYGTAAGLQDLTGTRVSVDTMPQVFDMVDKIRATHDIVEEDDYLRKANDGYRSYHFVARDDEGLEFEIQVRTKHQTEWADWAHKVYKPEEQTAEQRALLASFEEVIQGYRLMMSAYYYSLDDPKVKPIEPPPCPEVIKMTFGCMTVEN